MKKLISYKTAQKIDSISQRRFAIPGIVLMERAGQILADYVEARLEKDSELYVFCGGGNNGGDAQVLARVLWQKGYKVCLAFVREAKTDLARLQCAMLKTHAVPVISVKSLLQKLPVLKEKDWIVDGISGIGINRPLDQKEMVSRINASKARVLSIDVPSGLTENMNLNHSDPVVFATTTITFGLEKMAMYYPNTRDHCGSIVCANPGFPAQALDDADASAYLLEEEDLRRSVPPMPNYTYKHKRGVLVVAAGSKETPGAAHLAVEAATKSFAGMVYALVDESIANGVAIRSPSVITGLSFENIKKAHALVIGPGWGTGRGKNCFLKFFSKKIPTLVDADGLSYLSAVKPQLTTQDKKVFLVLSPHVGEMQGLHAGLAKNGDLWKAGKSVSKKYNAVVIAKNSSTAVFLKDRIPYIIDGSNPALANAGSGDVLSGLLGSYLAYCTSMLAKEGACLTEKELHYHTALAVFLHTRLARDSSRYFSSAELLLDSLQHNGLSLE